MPPAPGQEEALKRMTKIVNALLARTDCAPFREPVDWRGLELYDYPEIITKMMDLGTIKRKLERGHYATAHQVAEDVRLVWSNCMAYNADGSDFWLLAKSYARRFEDRYRKVKSELDVGETLDDDGERPGVTGTTAKSASASKSSNKKGNKDSSAASTSTGIHSPASPTGSTNSPGGASASATTDAMDEQSVASTTAGTPSLDARARLGANLFLLSGSELGHVMTTLEVQCPEVLEMWDKDKVEINVDEIPPKIFALLNSYVSDKVGTRSVPRTPEMMSGGGDEDNTNKPSKKRKKA